ncbi:MAG: adenine phosphoribosyltransferase [Maribacter sp.]|nr:adenine phosphoribosyltransferase [Maribacter sp.]
MDLKAYIRDIEDFPSKGILFKDITPLLKDSKAFKETLENLLKMVQGRKIDKVVGIESRGFFFGPLLALALNAGFVPVRKSGKLPSHTLGLDYTLEYGNDSLEVHSDSILTGERVLIHDDVLATGGTASTVCELVKKMGGEIVQCNFLIELDNLKGVEMLKDYEVKSMLHY